jgi:hypothetical protein
MAVLYILLDLDQDRRNLAFNTLVATKWPSLKPVLGRLNPFGGRHLLDGPADEEKARISSYLEYTEQLLRLKDAYRHDEQRRSQRAYTLGLLNHYWRRADFPDQYDYMGARKLAHQDKRGRFSALAWIVNQTAGADAPALIEALKAATDPRQVQLPAWQSWLDKSGLTLDEITML